MYYIWMWIWNWAWTQLSAQRLMKWNQLRSRHRGKCRDTGVTWAAETGRLQFQPQSNATKLEIHNHSFFSAEGFNFKL
ncbi:unnamed protein product [Caretta caretta]